MNQSSRLTRWLALLLAPGIGQRTLNQLFKQFPCDDRLLSMTITDLMAAGLNQTAAEKIAEVLSNPVTALNEAEIHKNLEWNEKHNCNLITIGDARYPDLLKEIADPPVLLWAHGAVEQLQSPQVAIVGARKATREGLDNACQFARYLADCGFTITSGMALGIDGKAHEGALSVDGKTIAVMGSGHDRLYPAQHADLGRRIVDQGGVVLSEQPVSRPPFRTNFPRRNRIISGLSLGVLVVEAGIKSGSLGTALSALDQGREVFAIPGSIHNPVARGSHKLIREGATLVETAANIVEELGALLQLSLPVAVPGLESELINRNENDDQFPIMSPEESKLFELLGYAPVSVDFLVEKTGMHSSQITGSLIMLEMQGLAREAPGGYVRAGGV